MTFQSERPPKCPTHFENSTPYPWPNLLATYGIFSPLYCYTFQLYLLSQDQAVSDSTEGYYCLLPELFWVNMDPKALKKLAWHSVCACQKCWYAPWRTVRRWMFRKWYLHEKKVGKGSPHILYCVRSCLSEKLVSISIVQSALTSSPNRINRNEMTFGK